MSKSIDIRCKWNNGIIWCLDKYNVEYDSLLKCFHKIHQCIENKQKKQYVCYNVVLNGSFTINETKYIVKYENHQFKVNEYNGYSLDRIIKKKIINIDYKLKFQNMKGRMYLELYEYGKNKKMEQTKIVKNNNMSVDLFG